MNNLLPTDHIHSCFYFKKRNKLLVLEKPLVANLIYKDRVHNLLNNKVSYQKNKKPQSFNFSLEKLLTSNKNYITHVFYEYNNLNVESSQENPLFLELEYSQKRWMKLPLRDKKKELIFPLKSISFSDYKKKFEVIREHLVQGDCYQVNLTHNFKYKILSRSLDSFVHKFYSSDQLESYAHHSYIPLLKKLYLSNSPECLFQSKIGHHVVTLESYPIKGTMVCNKDSFSKNKGQKLLDSKKDESELYMIADLIRNDLSMIDKPVAQVVAKKRLLKIKHLFHLYSVLKVKVSKKTSLGKLIDSMFPGGSITGAPKKRVSEIIKKIESDARGFYCGSTVFSSNGSLSSSINIRSGVFDFDKKIAFLGAGGGITLESDCQDEYKEMLDKLKSFERIFLEN